MLFHQSLRENYLSTSEEVLKPIKGTWWATIRHVQERNFLGGDEERWTHKTPTRIRAILFWFFFLRQFFRRHFHTSRDKRDNISKAWSWCGLFHFFLVRTCCKFFTVLPNLLETIFSKIVDNVSSAWMPWP